MKQVAVGVDNDRLGLTLRVLEGGYLSDAVVLGVHDDAGTLQILLHQLGITAERATNAVCCGHGHVDLPKPDICSPQLPCEPALGSFAQLRGLRVEVDREAAPRPRLRLSIKAPYFSAEPMIFHS
jgi:hypothetical protein